MVRRFRAAALGCALLLLPVPRLLASNPAAPRPLDACRLLPPEDAAELLGGPPEPAVTNAGIAASAAVSQCAYRRTATGGSLTLIARRSPEAPRLFERARAEAKLLLWADPQEVAGLGDKAYWTGVTFQQLNVLRGEVWLIVAADTQSGRGRQEEAKRLASRALARLRAQP